MIVFMAHTGNFGAYLHPWIAFQRFGQSGLFIFFFLSAYLISRPVFESGTPLKARTWIDYGARRLFRIVPLYTTICLFDFFVTHVFFNSSGTDSGEALSLVRHLLFQEGRIVFWTMPVEVAFYFLLVPLIAIFGLCLKRPVAMGALLAGTGVWYLYVAFFAREQWVGTWGVHPYAPYFIAGVAASAGVVQFRSMLKAVPLWTWTTLGGLALAIFMLQNPLWWQAIMPASSNVLDPRHPIEFNVVSFNADRYLWLVPITALIVVTTELGASPLRRLFSFWPLVQIGRISYGAYLTHFIVLTLVVRYGPESLPERFAITFVLTFGIALLLNRLIEKPGIALGRRLTRPWTRTPDVPSPDPYAGNREPVTGLRLSAAGPAGILSQPVR